jgi:predicted dehydrogenase
VIEKKLKVGIAGYGIVGKRRRIYIDQNPNLKTVSVSDITFPDSGKFQDGLEYFTDYKHLFNNEMDVLFVSLPNYLAAEATIEGLKHGCHVFCEKPPARTVADIEKVIEVEEKHPELKLKYGFNHRYHDSVKEAKKIIDANNFGPVHSIRAVYGKSSIIPFTEGWRSEKKFAGGGILMDQGIHMCDLIRLFSGDYDEIYSFISNDYWKHDIEDNAFALMKNKNGQVAMLHSTATQWQHQFRIEIILNNALLELTGILSGTKSYGSENLTIIKKVDDEPTGSQNKTIKNYLHDNSWKEEIDEFADCIVNNKPISDGTSEDALKVMEMIFKIYKADKKWWKYFNQN